MAAVTFGQMNALKAIAKIGISQALYDWAALHPLVVIKLTSGAFSFMKKDVAGQVTSVAVTVAQLTAIGKGTLYNSDKANLTFQISEALKKLYLYIEGHHWSDGKPLHASSSAKAGVAKALSKHVPKVTISGASLSSLPIPLGQTAIIDGHAVEAISSTSCKVGNEIYSAKELTNFLAKGGKLAGTSILAAKQLGIMLDESKIEAPGDDYLLSDPFTGINALAAADKAKPKAGIFAMLPELDDDVIPSISDANLWSLFPASSMTTAPLGKLSDATRLYEPVQGTGGASRYFVVGATKSFRIAARWQPVVGRLSVRIEPSSNAGPNTIGKFKGTIVAAGFDQPVVGKDYASVHLDCGPDAVLGAKTLAAVLAGLGLTFQTPIPNFKVIVGAAS